MTSIPLPSQTERAARGARREPSSLRRRRDRFLVLDGWPAFFGDGLFGAGLVTLIAYALWAGRGVWFFIDEWNIITHYNNGHWLQPFNGHLSIVPIAIYRGLLATVGYDFVWNRVVAVLCYAAAAVAMYVFARRRVHSIVAAIAALGVAWSSQAQLMILFPFLLNFSVPVAATIFIWVLLDRDRASADVGASALMALALATSAVGLLAPMTVGADLLVRRERRLRRWLTFLPPVALWVAWYAVDGRRSGAGGTVASVTSFASKELMYVFAGLCGGWVPGGVVLLIATVALVVVSIWRWKTFDHRAVAIAITLVGFVVLTAAGRNDVSSTFHVPAIPPDSDRYVWVGGALVIGLVVQCLRGRRIPTIAALAALGLLAGNAVVLAGRLHDYRATPVSNVKYVRTYLAAIDALGDRADPSRTLPLGILPVSTSAYLRLARHYGPAPGHPRLDQLGPESARLVADTWLVHDLDVRLSPTTIPPTVNCVAANDASAADGVAVRAPVSVVVYAGAQPSAVNVRRLANSFTAPSLGQVAAGATAVVRLPVDRATWPWHVRVTGTDARVSVCH